MNTVPCKPPIDLDLPGRPADTRVVVAMSGGVDSSVTAALVAEAGYDVVGITLQLYDHGEAIRRERACCAGRDIHDARDVAGRIGIPHYVLDYQSRFRRSVIDDFADSYLRGETPIPCVRCNQTVKFHDLLSTARELGAAALCTGHYVRRVLGDAGLELHSAADPAKDQSYFLFATTIDQLAYLRFPLGNMSKKETRAHARRLRLDVAGKPDSQDICFVPEGRYADTVRRLRPGAAEPGDIIHVNGMVLGRHSGVIDYTIGQRKGLGVGGRKPKTTEAEDTEPLYVVRVNPGTRQVTVGPRSALVRNVVEVGSANWIGDPPLDCTSTRVLVKLRSSQPPVTAQLSRLGSASQVKLKLDEPQYGVAPGQAAVFYAPDGSGRVFGGGWITAAAHEVGSSGQSIEKGRMD